ncbi:hypothetical protein T07_328 [Trichinella nelsoni]|uniref:Uncharacterized protein n=1 Tax=Trichinella nelsoni TaxID=6336 RepID=A0A0V0S054_9BILA|nr:hypothetical protein T07_328 [Trichinella nelsoni]
MYHALGENATKSKLKSLLFSFLTCRLYLLDRKLQQNRYGVILRLFVRAMIIKGMITNAVLMITAPWGSTLSAISVDFSILLPLAKGPPPHLGMITVPIVVKKAWLFSFRFFVDVFFIRICNVLTPEVLQI